MRVKDFEEELKQWETRYREWAEPINHFIRTSLIRVNRDGYTLADFQRELAAMREQRLAEYDPGAAVEPILEQMCAEYLIASPAERERCRAAVSENDSVQSFLLGYVATCADRIRSPEDLGPLRRGLAAASIENCATDYRDVFVALAKLFVWAERAGVDPVPHFREVGRLSSDATPRGGSIPVSKMLSEFQDYAVVSECRATSGAWPPEIPGLSARWRFSVQNLLHSLA
jgi:hypothetical protein